MLSAALNTRQSVMELIAAGPHAKALGVGKFLVYFAIT